LDADNTLRKGLEDLEQPFVGAKVTISDRQEILDQYAATSRAFSDSVERLRHLSTDVEAFIRVLDEVGTAHRACERSRIRLNKQLAQLTRVTHPEEASGRRSSVRGSSD
jgi:hypothetical protein